MFFIQVNFGDNMTVSSKIQCKCGMYRGWIEEDKHTSPCPNCGRIYTLKCIRGSYEVVQIKDSIFKKLFSKKAK